MRFFTPNTGSIMTYWINMYMQMIETGLIIQVGPKKKSRCGTDRNVNSAFFPNESKEGHFSGSKLPRHTSSGSSSKRSTSGSGARE
ncbi:hypothetical protein GQX74_014123 [Glossina fuscipes]|nr:hypothetical protein GQX74_014123 [Glossina fuscipes]